MILLSLKIGGKKTCEASAHYKEFLFFGKPHYKELLVCAEPLLRRNLTLA